MESAPLGDVEWAEDVVGDALGRRTEESLRVVEKQIQASEVFGCGLGEVFAGEQVSAGLRGHDGRGCAASGEVSASGDRVLGDASGDGGFGAGGSALGEAGADGGFSAGVGEEQMLDDLLDAPFVGAGGWLELGLGGVEVVERDGDCALELTQGGVELQWAGLRYT